VTDIAGGCHAADIGGDGENIFGRQPSVVMRSLLLELILPENRSTFPEYVTPSCVAAARSPAMETGQDHQPDEVGHHERDHAPEIVAKRHVLDDTLDHKDVHSDRRMVRPKFSTVITMITPNQIGRKPRW